METRRRRRDARANTENSRSAASQPAVISPANPSTVEPPSTRSRTRRTSVSNRSLRNTRTSRAASSNVATRSLSSPSTSSNPATFQAEGVADRSGKRTTSRRHVSSHQSTVNVNNSTLQAPVTRKRTRSISKAETGPFRSNTSAGQNTSATVLASQQNNPKPSKRLKRAASTGRPSRSAPGQSIEPEPSQQGISLRRNKGMSSTNPSDGGDDGNHNSRAEEEGPSSFGSDRGTPTTLQGLLRRLGADLSDILPGNGGTSHSRLQQLRTAITSPNSTEQQVDALSELCEFLSVGTEESLVSFSVNLFVGPLVNLLRTGSNVEIKIYAARALTHMMEALPSSASAIAINGAAGPLCQNLLSIEYIDLAEQSLSVLQKLSVDYPQQIVSANGFQAVLSYIDFFSIGIQRVAASTVCNLCRLPRGDAMEMISGALPTMMRLLSSEDQRIRESAVLGFTRLAEAFRSSSEKLETLCGEDASLVDKVLGLIVPSSPPALSPQSYSSALRLLALLSRGSAQLGLRILSTNSLILKLKSLLSSGSSMHAVDCLTLADSLIPDIAETESSSGYSGTTATRLRRRRGIGSTAALAAVDTKRRERLEQDEGLLQFFGQTLFETLMKFYVSSADSTARKMALSIMSKFIAIASEEVLFETVVRNLQKKGSLGQKMNTVRFCPFVAALLGENSSSSEALVGLAMGAAALQKLPSLKEDFVREGVIHEIVRLASLDRSNSDTGGQTSTAEILGNVEDGNQELGQEADRSNEATVPPATNTASAATNMRDLESVWTAVAALQRGASSRVGRSDPPGGTRRLPSRPVLDFRIPSVQAAQVFVPNAAKSILTTYLGADSDGILREGILQNSVFQKLSFICSELQSTATPEERDSEKAISDLFDLLTASEGLTVFELSKSRILEILSSYLSPSDPSARAERISHLAKRFLEDKREEAFSSLVALTLGVLSSEEKLSVQTNESPLGTASASVSSGLRQLTQPFKLRLRRAASETGPGSLRDYSHHVVLIEPLATMASVQDFLWPKVRESCNAGDSGRRRPRNERFGEEALVEDEDDDHGEHSDPEDGDRGSRSPEDRFAEMFNNIEDDNNEDEDAMAEDEDEHNSEGSDEDVSSGEEDVIEQDGGESDEHEHDTADALDVDQLGSSLPPFEVDHDALGQAPNRVRLNSDTEQRTGSASGGDPETTRVDTAFRSYAAALAANIPRSSREGSTGGASPSSRLGLSATGNQRHSPSSEQRLSFTLNGKLIAHDCSILTAITQSTPEDRGIGPRLWSEVHTLSYSRYRSRGIQVTPQRVSPRSPKDRIPQDMSGPVRRSQRLLESNCRQQSTGLGDSHRALHEPAMSLLQNMMISDVSLHPPATLSSSDLPTPVSAIVNVLKLLDWIFKRLCHDSSPGARKFESLRRQTEESAAQFVSHKLSAKLVRQISDPLALCGGVIPAWCFTLTREAPFLIPFVARRILFQSTSLGIPRALHLLQTRTELAGAPSGGHRSSRSHREGEARIARITRQKVRVHRNRILESAIKVMNIYSSHGTVLEVEYFGEVGTGLGPTLEFYTMASREIQRVDLGLWRDNTGKGPIQKESDISGMEEAKLMPHRIQASRAAVKRRTRRTSRSVAAKRMLSDTEGNIPPAYVVPTGNGLFPSCLPIIANDSQKEFSAKTTALFAFIGRLIGKAMIDGRLLDLRFSSVFSRLLLSYCRVVYEEEKRRAAKKELLANIAGSGRGKRPSRPELERVDRDRVWETFTEGTSALALLQGVDAQLANSLNAIMDMERNGQREDIPSLCLTFVLPGDDSIELIKDGCNMDVRAENAADFVRRVAYHVLFGGVYQQAEALLSGLEELIDITNLLVFEDRELELFICGPSFEKWTVESLVEATRCDHGYSHESSSVLHLLKVMSELDERDQQRFVRFITGSPALPLGGLRNLHPRLTIVRRTPETGRSPDECLPTVMTCTNYLKLPDYSTFEIAKKQIMYAVREGQGAFHLS